MEGLRRDEKVEGLEGGEEMQEMRRGNRISLLRRLASIKRWVLIALPVLVVAGALAVGVPALLAKPTVPEREQLVGFFGFPEETITQKPTVVLIERVGDDRIVTMLPGGMATKVQSIFYFSSRLTSPSEIEDVNGDGHLDLVVDGVILYNVGGQFTLQPPTPTPETPSGTSQRLPQAGQGKVMPPLG
nr:hypothetical protein [Anaerolineae bacterium]